MNHPKKRQMQMSVIEKIQSQLDLEEDSILENDSFNIQNSNSISQCNLNVIQEANTEEQQLTQQSIGKEIVIQKANGTQETQIGHLTSELDNLVTSEMDTPEDGHTNFSTLYPQQQSILAEYLNVPSTHIETSLSIAKLDQYLSENKLLKSDKRAFQQLKMRQQDFDLNLKLKKKKENRYNSQTDRNHRAANGSLSSIKGINLTSMGSLNSNDENPAQNQDQYGLLSNYKRKTVQKSSSVSQTRRISPAGKHNRSISVLNPLHPLNPLNKPKIVIFGNKATKHSHLLKTMGKDSQGVYEVQEEKPVILPHLPYIHEQKRDSQHNSHFLSSRDSVRPDVLMEAKLVNRGLFDSKYITNGSSQENFLSDSKKQDTLLMAQKSITQSNYSEEKTTVLSKSNTQKSLKESKFHIARKPNLEQYNREFEISNRQGSHEHMPPMIVNNVTLTKNTTKTKIGKGESHYQSSLSIGLNTKLMKNQQMLENSQQWYQRSGAQQFFEQKQPVINHQKQSQKIIVQKNQMGQKKVLSGLLSSRDQKFEIVGQGQFIPKKEAPSTDIASLTNILKQEVSIQKMSQISLPKVQSDSISENVPDVKYARTGALVSELNDLHSGIQESISKKNLGVPTIPSGRNTNTNTNNAFGTQNTILIKDEMEKTQQMKDWQNNNKDVQILTSQVDSVTNEEFRTLQNESSQNKGGVRDKRFNKVDSIQSLQSMHQMISKQLSRENSITSSQQNLKSRISPVQVSKVQSDSNNHICTEECPSQCAYKQQQNSNQPQVMTLHQSDAYTDNIARLQMNDSRKMSINTKNNLHLQQLREQHALMANSSLTYHVPNSSQEPSYNQSEEPQYDSKQKIQNQTMGENYNAQQKEIRIFQQNQHMRNTERQQYLSYLKERQQSEKASQQRSPQSILKTEEQLQLQIMSSDKNPFVGSSIRQGSLDRKYSNPYENKELGIPHLSSQLNTPPEASYSEDSQIQKERQSISILTKNALIEQSTPPEEVDNPHVVLPVQSILKVNDNTVYRNGQQNQQQSNELALIKAPSSLYMFGDDANSRFRNHTIKDSQVSDYKWGDISPEPLKVTLKRDSQRSTDLQPDVISYTENKVVYQAALSNHSSHSGTQQGIERDKSTPRLEPKQEHDYPKLEVIIADKDKTLINQKDKDKYIQNSNQNSLKNLVYKEVPLDKIYVSDSGQLKMIDRQSTHQTLIKAISSLNPPSIEESEQDFVDEDFEKRYKDKISMLQQLSRSTEDYDYLNQLIDIAQLKMPEESKILNKVTAGSKIADKTKMRNGKAKMGERLENQAVANSKGDQSSGKLILESSFNVNQQSIPVTNSSMGQLLGTNMTQNLNRMSSTENLVVLNLPQQLNQGLEQIANDGYDGQMPKIYMQQPSQQDTLSVSQQVAAPGTGSQKTVNNDATGLGYRNIGDLFGGNQDNEIQITQNDEIQSLKFDPTAKNSKKNLASFTSEMKISSQVQTNGNVNQQMNHAGTSSSSQGPSSGLENLSFDQLIQVSQLLKSEIATEVKELQELNTKKQESSHVTQQQLYKMSGVSANQKLIVKHKNVLKDRLDNIVLNSGQLSDRSQLIIQKIKGMLDDDKKSKSRSRSPKLRMHQIDTLKNDTSPMIITNQLIFHNNNTKHKKFASNLTSVAEFPMDVHLPQSRSSQITSAQGAISSNLALAHIYSERRMDNLNQIKGEYPEPEVHTQFRASGENHLENTERSKSQKNIVSSTHKTHGTGFSIGPENGGEKQLKNARVGYSQYDSVVRRYKKDQFPYDEIQKATTVIEKDQKDLTSRTHTPLQARIENYAEIPNINPQLDVNISYDLQDHHKNHQEYLSQKNAQKVSTQRLSRETKMAYSYHQHPGTLEGTAGGQSKDYSDHVIQIGSSQHVHKIPTVDIQHMQNNQRQNTLQSSMDSGQQYVVINYDQTEEKEFGQTMDKLINKKKQLGDYQHLHNNPFNNNQISSVQTSAKQTPRLLNNNSSQKSLISLQSRKDRVQKVVKLESMNSDLMHHFNGQDPESGQKQVDSVKTMQSQKGTLQARFNNNK